VEGTNKAHENGEAMGFVGVRLTVLLGHGYWILVLHFMCETAPMILGAGAALYVLSREITCTVFNNFGMASGQLVVPQPLQVSRILQLPQPLAKK